jgi:hypothetical protein
MASGGSNQRNDDFNFRPQSGTSGKRWSSRRYQNPYPNGRRSNRNDYDREWEHDRSRNNYSANEHGHRSSPAFELKAKDDEARAYAVNLQLKPVEMGIKARNRGWEEEFRGIGAFNHYFGLCAPTRGLGYTLPDIWDGYFHITLSKFFTHLTHDQLEEVFKRFNSSLEDLPFIPDIVFRSSRIETHSGARRARKLRHIDFVVLPIDHSDQTKAFYEKVLVLLEKIKEQVDAYDWDVTPLNDLHVTIRKYSNFNSSDLNKIKIQDFPLEFRCSQLEVKQPREQATVRYAQSNKKCIWWNGVTEDDHRCSGCGTTVMSETWEGFCLACGKYESMIPLWSTTGTNIQHQSSQQ